MDIVTESIREFLKASFNKDPKDLLISDALLVEFITLDGMDYEGHTVDTSFNDLRYFKNLKYLEVCNTMISNASINILSSFDRLESVVFRNCTFSKSIRNFNKLTNIKCIRIINPKNFSLNYISNLNNLKRVYVSSCFIPSLKPINKLILDALDISNTKLGSDSFKYINTKYLVISKDEYLKYENSILKLNCKVMVMGDKTCGYFIEKWIN